MISSKKLATIQDELRRAAAQLGEDPIQRLEETLAKGRPGRRDSKTDPVLESLRRLLEKPKKRVGKKKPVANT